MIARQLNQNTKTMNPPRSRILATSIAALLAVHHASAQTTITNGTTLSVSDVANFISTAGTVTIEDNATLFISGAQAAPPAGHNITNNLILEGATVNLNFNNNDTAYRFTGTISSTATGAQTLKVSTGVNGNGDREGIYFVSAIPDANAGASPLGLDLTYRTQSGSSSFVNLQGANTFTGPIAMHRNGPEVQRAYLVIGGQRHDLAFNANTFNTPGSGRLGAGGIFGGGILLDDTAMILNYNSTDNQTLSGAITGTGRLLLSGTGTLTLSGTNTYSGGTSFEGNGNNGTGSGGTLKMGAINALPTTGAVTVANLAGVAIDLDGFNTTIGSLTGGGASGGNVNLGANGVLTIGNSTSTYGGVISGTGTAGLTKQGGGALTLSSSAAHTYTGPTTINAGTLALTSSLNSSAVTVNDLATLKLATAADHALGTNLNFLDSSTLEVTAAGSAVAKATITGMLDVTDVLGTPTIKITPSGAFTPLTNTFPVIHWAGADPVNMANWNYDGSNIGQVNASLNQTSNWQNNPTPDVSWDTADNWSQQEFTGGIVVYDVPNKDLLLVMSSASVAPIVSSIVTIAPTNAKAVTGPASPAAMASLTLGNGGGNAHSLTLQAGGPVTVSGAVTVNPSGTLNGAADAISAGTLTVAGGSATVGAGSTAGIVNLGATGTLTAAPGNELAVSNKLSSGTLTITAGTSPFKVAGTNMTTGTNVINNLGKLIVQGGTTKLENAAFSNISLTDSGTAWGGGATNPVSNNFTVSAGANVLIVNIAARQAAGGGSYIGGPAPVVTYGGVPLTLATFGESPTQFFVDAWVYYMYNPATGSSLPLSTTFTSPNANTDYAVSALTLGGVDTAAAPKVGNGNSQTDSVSLTVSNIPTNSWLNSVAATRTNLATINQTVTSGSYGSLLNTGPGGGGNAFWLQNNNGGAMSAGGMLMTGITSSSVTLNSQVGGSFRWGAAAAAFAPNTGVFSINQPTTEVNVAATTTNTLDFSGAPSVSLGTLTMEISSGVTLTNAPGGVTFTNIVANGTSQINGTVPITVSSGNVSVPVGDVLTVGSPLSATTLTKQGDGTLTFGTSATLSGVGSLASTLGTTNINSALGGGSAAVTLTGASTVKFGSISQTLGSLTIGAGSTVTFTSGVASFSGAGGKGAGFAGAAAVPEPGTLGLLLVGALGALNRRRRSR